MRRILFATPWDVDFIIGEEGGTPPIVAVFRFKDTGHVAGIYMAILHEGEIVRRTWGPMFE